MKMEKPMMTLIPLILLGVILLQIIVGCTSIGVEEQLEGVNVTEVKLKIGFFRIVDYEAQIVCYRYWDNAMSCLRLSDTALPRG